MPRDDVTTAPVEEDPTMRSALPDLGIMLPLGGGLDAATILRLAVEADAAGVAALAAGEHASTELFSLLGAIAARTGQVRLESAVVSTVSRSAPLVAMAALTLDSLAPGRFSLGVGAGSPMVAGWHGRPFDRPATRMRSFLEALRPALAGDRVEDHGRFRALSRPAPGVPVRLAAANPRMLALAATHADGVLLNFAGRREVARIATAGRQARADAGIGAPYAVHVMRWTALDLPPAEARRAFAREVGPYLAVPAYAAAAAEIAGQDAIDAAGQAWRDGGREGAAAAVPDALADELLVTGDAGDLAAHATALAATGTDAVRFLPLTPDPATATGLTAVIAALAQLS
jgi:alkanesulfonate monooxygenase SsuD/methylene tetrahydromethanopterin reductase-like flavin-dependent oxidoreductase (luciferase family)